MDKITSLTADYKQKLSIPVEETGNDVILEFKFSEAQGKWFFKITYEDVERGWYVLTNSPNIIRENKNTLPFGLLCYVNDGLEPLFLDDFDTGRVSLYLLTSEEVDYIEGNVYVE